LLSRIPPTIRTTRGARRLLESGVAATALTCVVLGGLGLPTAHAVTSVRPRAGSWTGQEKNGTAPSPVSFTVSARGASVTNFSGEAIVRAGCVNHIQGFSAPTGPMPITAGRFHGVETSYPQRGVRVTVTGTFTTRATVRGHIAIHFKRVDGCDTSRAFTARRSTG
jgi:hypothetical protein